MSVIFGQHFSNSVGHTSRGHDAMLEGVHLAPGNRYAHAIFIDNGLIYIELGAQNIFCFHLGPLKNN